MSPVLPPTCHRVEVIKDPCQLGRAPPAPRTRPRTCGHRHASPAPGFPNGDPTDGQTGTALHGLRPRGDGQMHNQVDSQVRLPGAEAEGAAGWGCPLGIQRPVPNPAGGRASWETLSLPISAPAPLGCHTGQQVAKQSQAEEGPSRTRSPQMTGCHRDCSGGGDQVPNPALMPPPSLGLHLPTHQSTAPS